MKHWFIALLMLGGLYQQPKHETRDSFTVCAPTDGRVLIVMDERGNRTKVKAGNGHRLARTEQFMFVSQKGDGKR